MDEDDGEKSLRRSFENPPQTYEERLKSKGSCSSTFYEGFTTLKPPKDPTGNFPFPFLPEALDSAFIQRFIQFTTS